MKKVFLAALVCAIGVLGTLGVAVAGPSLSDPMELLARADEALYEAKRSGRNRYAVARPVIRAVG